MGPLTGRQPRGLLIVEAVVAAFLMIFAFAASTSLFHAALQWESQSGNVRKASLLAERKLGEIRAWSEKYHSTHPFDDGWAAPITGLQADYDDAPGFAIEVTADLPTRREIPLTSDTPPPGVYSPTSHFWAPPPSPGSLPNIVFENPQKNPEYATFSRVRTFGSSFRRVQIVVRYGNGGSREFRCLSLVGDPVTRATGSGPVITIARTAGNSTVSLGNPSDYAVTVSVNGHPVDDVVCLWGVDPQSTGAVMVVPTDSNGRSARVWRPAWGNAGNTRLAVRLRYRGQQYSQLSESISVL